MFAFFLLFFTTRETKRRELEEMDVEFGVPTTKVEYYRLRVEISYLFRRNILRQDVALQPFEELVQSGSEVHRLIYRVDKSESTYHSEVQSRSSISRLIRCTIEYFQNGRIGFNSLSHNHGPQLDNPGSRKL